MQSSEQTEQISSPDSTCSRSDYFLTTILSGYVNRLYNELTEMNPHNAKTIRNYIDAEKVEIHIKESTMADKIKKLCWLSRHLNHKSFTYITKQDIVNYLDSIRKPESEDPGHRSIGIYNGIRSRYRSALRPLCCCTNNCLILNIQNTVQSLCISYLSYSTCRLFDKLSFIN
jgi:hypothetical protein